MLVCFLGTVSADNVNVTQQQENIDVKGIVFGHIGDSYEWHITTWGNTKVVVPLPIIVRRNRLACILVVCFGRERRI